ncbi:MAG: hypothetical protein ABSG31_05245 [Tepidisphaeraceae bacterium]
MRRRFDSRRLARRRSGDPSRNDGVELSPAAINAAEFRAQAGPSTVLHAPSPTSPWKSKSSVPSKSPGQVGQAGLHWTVEVALGRETPSHPAAAGGTLSLPRPIESADATVAGPASWPRGGSRLTYSSKSTLVGGEIVTDPISLSKHLSKETPTRSKRSGTTWPA